VSTADCKCDIYAEPMDTPLPAANGAQPMQRLAEVQREQSISDRTMASRLELSMEELRRQKSPEADLPLSALYRWHEALDVPIADLLVEPGPALAPVVERRARLVKTMKTVRSLQLAADSPEIGVLVERLAEQLIELMPELVNVDSWPIVGKRRSTGDISPLEERMLPDETMDSTWTPDREL
jgi:hypothetical protein